MLRKLFGFGKRNDEVEVKEDVATANLATILLLSMSEYLKEAEKSSGVLVPVIPDIEKAYDRLVHLGLQGTQNARLLKAQIDERDAIKMDHDRAQNLIRFVKEAHRVYGPRTILVSRTAFQDVCRKYNLGITTLKNYNGVIPVQNILDLENVMNQDRRFIYTFQLNQPKYHKFFCVEKIRGKEYAYDYIDGLHKHVADKFNVIETSATEYYLGRYIVSNEIIGYPSYSHPNLVELWGEFLTPKTFLIACPEKYIDNPKVEVTNLPVDPIVFRFCPYGVLIHTMWGEEAEDQVLKEFEALNGRIIAM